jgi:transmembrane sensor
VIDRRSRAEAAAWLARLQSDAPTAQDRAGCEAWLAASQAHRRALAEATAAWDAVGGLAPSSLPQPGAPGRFEEPKLARRAVLAGGLGAASLLAVWAGSATRSYATGIGESRTLRLDDGSRLTLDACSEVRAGLVQRMRRLELVRGRIALEVAPDPERPYVVTREARRVLAFGRSLDVACLNEGLAVTAVDGLVLVQQPGREIVRLESGERLRTSHQTGLQTDRPELQSLTAWRDGRLVFADETLAEATAEINRYTARPVELADSAVGALRISGSYRTRSAEAFARSVAMLYGLEVVREPDRLVLRKSLAAGA